MNSIALKSWVDEAVRMAMESPCLSRGWSAPDALSLPLGTHIARVAM